MTFFFFLKKKQWIDFSVVEKKKKRVVILINSNIKKFLVQLYKTLVHKRSTKIRNSSIFYIQLLKSCLFVTLFTNAAFMSFNSFEKQALKSRLQNHTPYNYWVYTCIVYTLYIFSARIAQTISFAVIKLLISLHFQS